MPGWKIVSYTMLVGCLNLAGVPFVTSGFWSKDLIIGDALANPEMAILGWLLLLTAGMTAYYTFRVYFRVFVGPVEYHPGDEIHGHADEGHADAHGHDPHGARRADSPPPRRVMGMMTPTSTRTAPGWAINAVLSILAVASFIAIGAFFPLGTHGWMGSMIPQLHRGGLPRAPRAARGPSSAPTRTRRR